jgi:hypothetical protein
VGSLKQINFSIVLAVAVTHDLVFIDKCALLIREVSIQVLLAHKIVTETCVLNTLGVVCILDSSLLLSKISILTASIGK